MAKRNIDKAKEAKKDEFYTQLEDIKIVYLIYMGYGGCMDNMEKDR